MMQAKVGSGRYGMNIFADDMSVIVVFSFNLSNNVCSLL